MGMRTRIAIGCVARNFHRCDSRGERSVDKTMYMKSSSNVLQSIYPLVCTVWCCPRPRQSRTFCVAGGTGALAVLVTVPMLQCKCQCPITTVHHRVPIADIRQSGPSFPSPALPALSFAGEKFIIIDPRICLQTTEKELLLVPHPSTTTTGFCPCELTHSRTTTPLIVQHNPPRTQTDHNLSLSQVNNHTTINNQDVPHSSRPPVRSLRRRAPLRRRHHQPQLLLLGRLETCPRVQGRRPRLARRRLDCRALLCCWLRAVQGGCRGPDHQPAGWV